MGYLEKYKGKKADFQARHEAQKKKSEEGGGYRSSIFDGKKIPDDIGFWSPKEGEHLIDLICWEATELFPDDEIQDAIRQAKIDNPTSPRDSKLWPIVFAVDLWTHKRIGVAKDDFICQVHMFRTKDPMCEHLNANPGLPKLEWNALRAYHQYIYYIWDHTTPQEEQKGLQIWRVPSFFFQEKVDEIATIPQGGGVIPYSSPDMEGKTIAFKIKGSRDQIEYLGHRFIDRKRDLPEYLLEKACKYPLESLLVLHPEYKTMFESLYGEPYVEGAEGEHKARPVTSAANVDNAPSPTGGDETRTTTTRKAEGAGTSEPSPPWDKCYRGRAFGVDTDKFAECLRCPGWDDCFDAGKRIGQPTQPTQPTQPSQTRPTTSQPVAPEPEKPKRLLGRRK